ncbi:hypothetical protein TorRG33x02_147270, partial [Trema orientale]
MFPNGARHCRSAIFLRVASISFCSFPNLFFCPSPKSACTIRNHFRDVAGFVPSWFSVPRPVDNVLTFLLFHPHLLKVESLVCTYLFLSWFLECKIANYENGPMAQDLLNQDA